MTRPLTGRAFWKMTGSGNDFVVLDNRLGENDDLADRNLIGRLCDRRNGVGADGLVLTDRHSELTFGMRYFNRDGSLAEMCGNAALCCARLAGLLGIAGEGTPFEFDTSSGPVKATLREDGPELDMVAVRELDTEFTSPLEPGELCMGYARVGVPHLIVLCDDVDLVDVERRGGELRRLAVFPAGANANFVSRSHQVWRMRTFERGVEQETLACGTGAVAAAALLNAWGLASGEVALGTRSGRELHAAPNGGERPPSLRGEARVVFRGRLEEF